MWKNVVEGNWQQMTMRIECWLKKATDTHTHTHTHTLVICIIAFPLQQRLHEHSSM